jgi:hypothetical protein
MKADRIGPMRGPGREHSGSGPRGVTPRMGHELAPISAVEPGDQDDAVPHLDSAQGIDDVRLEFDPGLGAALVALLRGRLDVGQRRGDAPDDTQLRRGYGRVIQSISGCA